MSGGAGNTRALHFVVFAKMEVNELCPIVPYLFPFVLSPCSRGEFPLSILDFVIRLLTLDYPPSTVNFLHFWLLTHDSRLSTLNFPPNFQLLDSWLLTLGFDSHFLPPDFRLLTHDFKLLTFAFRSDFRPLTLDSRLTTPESRTRPLTCNLIPGSRLPTFVSEHVNFLLPTPALDCRLLATDS